MGGRGSFRFITILHRGGSPQFITILHRGGRQNLLQYYSFERKMEGYNPFSALNKLKGFHFILFNVDLCLHVLSQLRKSVAITHFWGVHPDYYDITKGGSLKFITILQRGRGGLSGPQICIT